MLIECLPFQNVVNTGKATINFANLLGYSVEYLMLELGGTFTKAMITDIDIKANAKTIHKNTGSRLDDMNEYRGETADAAYLIIPFDESRARTESRGEPSIDGQKIGSIDTTAGILALTGEIDITGATSPTLKAYAEVSNPQSMDARFRALISKVLNFTVSPAAAGTFPFDVPYGRQTGALVKRIHLFGATVTAFEVKRNGVTIQKATAAANTYAQKRFGRVPQSNVVTIDFIKDGNQTSALQAFNASTMEYYMTVSGSGNVGVVVELYDPLNNN